MLGMWRKARGKAHIPRVNASMFMRDHRIGKNICLQFMGTDKTVRIVYAGSNVEKLFGVDLTGTKVASTFATGEHNTLHDMQQIKFTHPIIVHSHSNITTPASEMIQLEMLQLPFICQTTDEIVYVVGGFEWTRTIVKKAGLRDRMLKDRMLLSRTVPDVKTIKPIDSEFTYPPIEGLQKAEDPSNQVELI